MAGKVCFEFYHFGKGKAVFGLISGNEAKNG
jgi:hypothetical protein